MGYFVTNPRARARTSTRACSALAHHQIARAAISLPRAKRRNASTERRGRLRKVAVSCQRSVPPHWASSQPGRNARTHSDATCSHFTALFIATSLTVNLRGCLLGPTYSNRENQSSESEVCMRIARQLLATMLCAALLASAQGNSWDKV